MLEVKGSDGEPWYKIDIPILGVIRDCEPAPSLAAIEANDLVLEKV